MTVTQRRRSFTAFILLSLALIGFSTRLLWQARIHQGEAHFAEQVQDIAGAVRQQLDTNEAVLAGFSAFLQAVEQSDEAAATRYAQAVLAAYPHLYMLEVATAVPNAEQSAFEALLQRTWRADFRLKDFGALTGQPTPPAAPQGPTWPILFMYPSLPQASALYGVRLETVGHLSQALARLQDTARPLATPVFTLYEGGQAYILLQKVDNTRPATAPAGPSFFGRAMVALLMVRTDTLLLGAAEASTDPALALRATLDTPGGVQSLLFEKAAIPASAWERLLLPNLRERLAIGSASQPMTLQVERQLRLADVLSLETLLILVALASALVLLPLMLVRHFRALTRAEREHERAAYLATHDVLTGLPNRFLLTDRFEQAFAQWQRHGVAFAVMVVDLDRFKEINDRFGHETGDQVLMTTAERMCEVTRSGDTIARFGGDEFVVLARELLLAEDAEKVARKLLAAISRPIRTVSGEHTVTCSIGVALCPAHGQRFDSLLAAADHAMYAIKQAGREGIAISGEDGLPRTRHPAPADT